jgi:hypothetical protein
VISITRRIVWYRETVCYDRDLKKTGLRNNISRPKRVSGQQVILFKKSLNSVSYNLKM